MSGLALALALSLLACAGDPGAEAGPTLAEGAASTIFASQSTLGPHVMRVSVRRSVRAESTPGEQISEETLLLRWQDTDHWRLERARDGRPVEGVTIWDNVAWHDGADGPVRKPDAEPARVLLAQTWDPWRLAFEQVDASLVLTDVGVETTQGRKAHRHSVTARAPVEADAAAAGADPPRPAARTRAPRPRRGAFEVTAASGDVWIDEATAVRLAADVRVDARAGAQQHTTVLHFALEQIGGDVGLTPITEATSGTTSRTPEAAAAPTPAGDTP